MLSAKPGIRMFSLLYISGPHSPFPVNPFPRPFDKHGLRRGLLWRRLVETASCPLCPFSLSKVTEISFCCVKKKCDQGKAVFPSLVWIRWSDDILLSSKMFEKFDEWGF